MLLRVNIVTNNRDKASEKQCSLHFGNNIPYLIFFHVKTMTCMARTLAHTLARMTRIVTRMARWLTH